MPIYESFIFLAFFDFHNFKKNLFHDITCVLLLICQRQVDSALIGVKKEQKAPDLVKIYFEVN